MAYETTIPGTICSGYHYPDNVVRGFSHTHLQGTGGTDLGDILPVVEGRNWSWDANVPEGLALEQIEALGTNSGWVLGDSGLGYCSFFSHQQEVIRAGYYSVHLQTPDAQAELTATTRCGMHCYTYPASLIQTIFSPASGPGPLVVRVGL